jgi:amidase
MTNPSLDYESKELSMFQTKVKCKQIVPTSLGLGVGLFATALTSGCGALSGPEFGWKPEEATVKDVRSLVKANVVSCQKMVERYRLLQDSLDPTLRAISTWNEQVMKDAERLDRTPGGQRGAFHCVPIVVKDNINVTGMPTTGGAQALGSAITGNNAAVVDRLLGAGAIILGKTNMPDFATDGTSTLSSFGGQTANPYDRTLTTYGSSGGTGSAIAASLGIIGLGSDTYGSLLQPGSAGGLVAIRSTQGLVPSGGTLPLMSLQDVVGPMTRTVEDAAATLELLVDRSLASKGSQSYTTGLSNDGLKGLRVGYDPALLGNSPAPPMTPSPEVIELFDKTLENLRQAGALTQKVDALLPLFPALSAAINTSFQCMPVDFKESFNKYLQTLRPEARTRTLADVIATGEFLPSVKSFLDDAEAKTDSIATSAACQQYLADRTAAQNAIVAMMDREGLDLFVYPAANQPPFAPGKPAAGWFGFQALSSNTGLPSLTMPMGLTDKTKVPVGLVLLSRAYGEAKLVQAAYAFESRVHPRVRPANLTP